MKDLVRSFSRSRSLLKMRLTFAVATLLHIFAIVKSNGRQEFIYRIIISNKFVLDFVCGKGKSSGGRITIKDGNSFTFNTNPDGGAR